VLIPSYENNEGAVADEHGDVLNEKYGESPPFRHDRDGLIPVTMFAQSGPAGSTPTLPVASYDPNELSRFIAFYDQRDMIGIGNAVCAYVAEYFRKREVPETEGEDYLRMIELILTRLYGLPDAYTIPRVYQNTLADTRYSNTWSVSIHQQLLVYAVLLGATDISQIREKMSESDYSFVASYQHAVLMRIAENYQCASRPGREIELRIDDIREKITECDALVLLFGWSWVAWVRRSTARAWFVCCARRAEA